MKYILDTNAVSGLMKGDPSLITKVRQVASADLAIPQPVLAELAFGIARLPNSKRKSELARRFLLVRSNLRHVEWSEAVSDAFGQLKAALERKGQLIEDFDVAIAAHAVALDAVLVSSNGKHMKRIPGLRLQDWAGS